MEGEGTYTWPSGVKYVGEWKGGKRNGVGTMFFKDGAKAFTSDWRNDARVDLDEEEGSDDGSSVTGA